MARSEALRFGKDGEPTNPPRTHEKWEPWKVVVVFVETNKRMSKKYFSYVEAKQRVAEFKEKYGDEIQVGIVSRQVGYGPPESKVSDQYLLDRNNDGLYWCPYCRNFRKFNYVPALEVHWCEFCHMRRHDFHTIRCNPLLWDPDHFKRVFGGYE